MKKVLFVLPCDQVGGAEKILFELCSFLNDEKYDVRVLFLKKSISGYWNRNLPMVKKEFFNSSSEFFGIINLLFYFIRNRSSYDYIYTTHLHLNGTIGFFRKLRLVKSKFHIGRESTFVFDRFKGLKLTFFKTFYFFGYSKIDLLITQSDMMKERLISSLNSFSVPKKVLTIPNLFNLKDVEKKSLEFVPKFSNYIVSAGRLIPEKGFDVLIDSFVSLNSNKKLIILGEGYERKKLQNLIESHNQSDNIILHGFVDNPMPYFKNADLCVVSSRIEGFPNVLLQMMALNNNVVSTLCAPGVEKLKGVNTCKVSDVGDLSISMSDVLDAQTDNSTVFKTELEKRNVPSFWKTIKRAL